MSFLIALFLALGTAWASPGLEAVSRGDLARYHSEHNVAKAAYKEAVESGEPAAEAMARLRLLAYTGNLGAWIHGPRLDKALARATGSEAVLAWTDFHLFAPVFVGADRAEAARLAESLLEDYRAEATARLFLATGDRAWLEKLRAMEKRDGLGEGLVATEGALPPNPSAWNLGFGFSGAPGLGIGAGLRFTHPDFKGWATDTWLGGTTLGSGYGVLRARSPGTLFFQIDGGASRGLLYRYPQGERESLWRTARWFEAGPGLQWRALRTWVVGVFRQDDLGEGFLDGHGFEAGAQLDWRRGWGAGRRGAYFSAQWTASLSQEAPHQGLFVDVRSYVPFLKGVWATRLTHQHAFVDEAPFYRLPAVGGMTLHRGAPYQRWRAEWIATVDVEQRWMVWGPIEGVVFGNTAWVAGSGLHPAGGVGARLLMPPEESNVSRLDLAFSDTGWGLYGAWGEAF